MIFKKRMTCLKWPSEVESLSYLWVFQHRKLPFCHIAVTEHRTESHLEEK